MTTLKVVLVEDHALVARGFKDLLSQEPDLEIVNVVETVREVVHSGCKPDLVVLDLRLSDGSSPTDNVAALHAIGANVLIYTGAEDARLIRAAARSGALGLVRKSADPATLVDAIRTAGQGLEVFSTEWAAAIDADSGLANVKLSTREYEVLQAYASGETAQTIANRLHISRDTVADYVSRIRRKYSAVGRPAQSRVDLYRRAVEDGIVKDEE